MCTLPTYVAHMARDLTSYPLHTPVSTNTTRLFALCPHSYLISANISTHTDDILAGSPSPTSPGTDRSPVDQTISTRRVSNAWHVQRAFTHNLIFSALSLNVTGTSPPGNHVCSIQSDHPRKRACSFAWCDWVACAGSQSEHWWTWRCRGRG